MSPRFSLQGRRRYSNAVAGVGLLGLVGGFAAMLAGCPIYASDSCSSDPNCQPTAYPGTDSGAPTDGAPTDGGTCSPACTDGYTCDTTQPAPTCVAVDCRATEKKCATGKTCTNSGGVWSCTSTTPTDCATTGCITGYTCAPGTAGSRICVSSDPNACDSDAACGAKTGAGSLCVGGVCKAPKDLCSDQNQCNAGSLCVAGRCVPSCGTATSPKCADGYVCDSATGACTAGGGACSATSPCGSGLVCAEGRCVDKAATNGACPTGEVSVDGGCVIDDRANFFCDATGTNDGKQDICHSGSICLHHNCYVSCPAVGTASAACVAVKGYPDCKAVTANTGAVVDVCGSATTLGSECDPTSTPPKACATGKVCIDGYCR